MTTKQPTQRLNRIAFFNSMIEIMDTLPDQFDMRYFRAIQKCGTTMCIAGWACEIAGYGWEEDSRDYDDLGGAFVADELRHESLVAPELAGRLLNLDWSIASVFYWMIPNDLLRKRLKALIRFCELKGDDYFITAQDMEDIRNEYPEVPRTRVSDTPCGFPN